MRLLAARETRRTIAVPTVTWRKSSYSSYNGNCIEAADLASARVGVRDSQDTSGAILDFTPAGWDAFIGSVRNGQINL